MVNRYEKMVVIFIDILGTKNNYNFANKMFIHNLFHLRLDKMESIEKK